MSNALYDSGRNGFLVGSINWLNDTIKAMLVDAQAYTLDLAAHQFLSSVPAGSRTAPGVTLANKTAAAGVADADDVTFNAVTGAQSEYIILYKDTGAEATSPLIACIDTATGLPVTPNGGNISVSWSNGTNKIFKL